MNWKTIQHLVGEKISFQTLCMVERIYKTNDDFSVPEEGVGTILGLEKPSLLSMSLVTIRLENNSIGSIPAEYLENVQFGYITTEGNK